MRIAVTTQKENLEAEVESRFGRAPKFLIIDSDTMAFAAVENTQSMDLSQGAGKLVLFPFRLEQTGVIDRDRHLTGKRVQQCQVGLIQGVPG